MEGSKKGSFDEGLDDRLSDLPDCLIHCIMNCLPMGDAVRTSVLSKRFRHCWKGKQVLKFDENFYKHYIEGKDRRFEEVVALTFARLSGPALEFELNFPPLVEEVNDATERRQLTLPHHIYNNSHLTKLSIKNSRFINQYLFSCGYSNLVSLSFFEVHVIGTLLEDLICMCPKLKILVLVDLMIVDSHPAVVVDAHELRTLEYRSSGSALRLKYFPHLTSATIHSKIEFSEGELERSPFEQFFSLMPKIEELNLGDTALSSLVDRKVPENVQEVSLNSIATPKFLSCAVSLISISLNLKRLELNFEEATIQTDPDKEAELQFSESELIDGIEVTYLRCLHSGQFNAVIASIKEIIRLSIMIREKRNGTLPLQFLIDKLKVKHN